MNILSVESLHYKINKKTIFENTSLIIPSKSIICLLGRNGAGKTTFFDLICKLREPTNGSVTLNCPPPAYLSQVLWTPAVLKMADIFNMLVTLSDCRSGAKNRLIAKLENWSPTLAARYKDIWRRRPATCSYGEIRCFFTLSLLATEPELLILDEPTAGVDPEFRHYIWLCIEQARQEGTTILVSSHHIEEVAQHCDRFHMIHERKLLPFDSAHHFMEQYSAGSLDEAFLNANQ
jgi:ABC-2 type transport system ATP-binding protein